ncbi:MAG TPA: outer membrane beta-barrel protein [Chitinophagaceae bacterium]|nr:outer membrane beta-barrel protein [Chitinophagaceae bacterium]
MLKKTFLSVSLLAGYVFSFAQDSTKAAATPPPVTITGSVDVYYRANLSAPTGANNNYTSFTNSNNSFELGMASLRADHSFGKASATVDLGFGRRAEEFAYANTSYPSLFAVKQAFVSYAISDNFKLTMGKWGTHIGYEVLDAYLNRNYSMDYMFSYGPFSHTGIKADIGLGGVSTLMLGIANPTDNVTTTSGTKYIIGQFGTGSKNGKVKAYLNYQGANWGSGGSVNQLDLVVTATVTDKFSLGYNGTDYMFKPKGGSSESWWGSALYLNVDPTTNFGMTLRGEYFSDKDGIIGSGTPTFMDGSVFDATLSFICKVGNLAIIPELRLDNGSKEIFTKSDGTASKSTFTALLAATYHF